MNVNFQVLSVYLAIAVICIFAIFVLVFISRYRAFTTDQYVLHFRNGKIKNATKGGKYILIPIIDRIVKLPTTTQQTLLEAKEQVLSREFQNVSVTAYVFWTVTDPKVAFSQVSWERSASNYVEKVMKNAAESIIRTTCANMAIEDIIREREMIIKKVTDELHTLAAGWGIAITSVEVRDVEVIDNTLKTNMEAEKKISQEKHARLARALMNEETGLRDLDVKKKLGQEDQRVLLEIQQLEKQKEIRVQELERQRIEIEADAKKRRQVIEAEGSKIAQIASEVDVEAEKIKRIAEAEKFRLLARAEGEAERIRKLREAEAEGIQKRVDALAKAPAGFFQEQLIRTLPEIYDTVKVDKLLVMGKDDGINTIAASIAQLLATIPEIAESAKLKKEKEKSKE